MLILLILLICYSVFLSWLIFILLVNKPARNFNRSSLPVSIVIPFRNEQDHLNTLLLSLQDQSYCGSFEVLLINDGSTDQSVEVIRNFQKHSKIMISLLDSTYNPERKLTSKQQALDFGINHTRHDWIALTDADMKLHPDWLNLLMNSTKDNPALVFGHTSLVTDNTLFNKIQAFQLDFLFSAAFAFFKAGITGSCMGNNMLISKQAYLKAGGQKAIGFNIAEDRALLNLFRKKNSVISCTDPFKPLALTFPCNSWKQFFHQFCRWAKGGFVWRSTLFLIGILFSIQNLLLLSSICLILPPLLSSVAIGNFILTWLFTAASFRRIFSDQKFHFFPFFFLFLLFETIFFFFSILFRFDIEWKGRKLNH
ncbi:MAG TPA: glycosyltransferase [Chitinispirillaceae bacterium]|nr:glycosyltransferase [Chitinispirillaceae bacterium]